MWIFFCTFAATYDKGKQVKTFTIYLSIPVQTRCCYLQTTVRHYVTAIEVGRR